MSYKTYELEVLRWAEDSAILKHSTPESQLLKVMSELGKVADAVTASDNTGFKDGMGNVMIRLILLADMLGLDITSCLESAYEEVKYRTALAIRE